MLLYRSVCLCQPTEISWLQRMLFNFWPKKKNVIKIYWALSWSCQSRYQKHLIFDFILAAREQQAGNRVPVPISQDPRRRPSPIPEHPTQSQFNPKIPTHAHYSRDRMWFPLCCRPGQKKEIIIIKKLIKEAVSHAAISKIFMPSQGAGTLIN